MERRFYLDLARSGLRMPIGADLVLHEQADPDRVLRDGVALGKVVEETARRYRTPLAFAHMDLSLEKAVLLELMGVPEAEVPLYHFSSDPGPEALVQVEALARLLVSHLGVEEFQVLDEVCTT